MSAKQGSEAVQQAREWLNHLYSQSHWPAREEDRIADYAAARLKVELIALMADTCKWCRVDVPLGRSKGKVCHQDGSACTAHAIRKRIEELSNA